MQSAHAPIGRPAAAGGHTAPHVTVDGGTEKKTMSHGAQDEYELSSFTFCEYLIILGAWLATIILVPMWCQLVRQVKDYERAVIFRLGKVTGGAQGPGVFIINPLIDQIRVLDLRVTTVNLSPQDVMTKDSVTVRVDAVAFMKVGDPVRAVLEVEDYIASFSLFCQTTLRAVIGGYELSSLLSERDEINEKIRAIIDEETDAWGVVVPAVEVKDVSLPANMQRAMAAEAEAERERRAKIISSRGEAEAAAELARAAHIISNSAGALQLRYLHTLRKVAEDQNSTVLFPLPVEFLRAMAE